MTVSRGIEVVIVGAGIIGCALARELASNGATVTVIDRGAPGSGTTAHGEGNVLVSDKGPGPELELARLSRMLWPDTVAAIAEQCGPLTARLVEWEAKGGIVVATTEDGARALGQFSAHQARAGVDTRQLTTDEIRAAEPFLTHDLAAAFHYPEDAQVQPVAAAHALLASAKMFGASVIAGTEVIAGIHRSGTLTGIRTTGGAVYADAIVNCAGPWSAQVSRALGAPIAVKPRRGEVMVTTPQPPTVFHKVYDADYVGAVGSGSAELQTSAVVESTHAGPVLIGSSRRQVPLDNDGPHLPSLEQMARKAIRLFPHLADVEIMRTYGGFRPYVDDHLPVIGADPRLPGLWHATGHEGAGIGLCLGTAVLLRSLLLGAPCPVAAEDFRVDRPAIITERIEAAQ